MIERASTTARATSKRAESQHKLLRFENRYGVLTRQLAWVTNADGEVEEDVPFWRTYTGQSYEEVKGWGWLKCVHPDDAERVKEVWTKAVVARAAYESEYRVRRHDGVYRYFRNLAVPVFGNDGGVREWVGICVDITERMRAEEELAYCTAELEAIFAAQNDAVLVYDTDMNVCRANPAFLEVYGFDPVGLHVKDIVQTMSCRWLDGRPFEWEEQPTPRALRGEKVTGARYLITRADGTEMVVETSSGPLLVGGRITGSVTVWHDITERQKAEEALLRVRAQLEYRIREMAEMVKKVLDDPERAMIDSNARSLTAREIEVLALVAEGTSSKVIADRLLINIHTVNRHRANIMEKLKTHKMADLVKYAISHGLVVR